MCEHKNKVGEDGNEMKQLAKRPVARPVARAVEPPKGPDLLMAVHEVPHHRLRQRGRQLKEEFVELRVVISKK